MLHSSAYDAVVALNLNLRVKISKREASKPANRSYTVIESLRIQRSHHEITLIPVFRRHQ